MIEVIINDHGGLTVVHDEKRLDKVEDIEIELGSGATALMGNSIDRINIGRLRSEMLEFLKPGMPAQIIRVAGTSLAKISPLMIRTIH